MSRALGWLLKAAEETEKAVEFVGEEADLDSLQGLVGGFIETIDLGRGFVLVVDEDGRLKGKPLNRKASQIARRPIVGDAVYIEGKYL